MEKEDYECLFLKSDVIFLPYPRSFQYRTSGVLLEALSNHKKALVSDTSYFRQYQNVGIDIRYLHLIVMCFLRCKRFCLCRHLKYRRVLMICWR